MAAMLHDLLAAAAVAGRTCAGLVFLLAATQKAQHWRILPGVIANYRLLQHWMTGPAAALLPLVEMALAILLLSALFNPWPSLAAMALLLLFAAAMAINIRRGRGHIDCGCGEIFLRQTLSWTLVGRNSLLAVLLMPSLVTIGPANMPIILTATAAGIGLFLLYLLFNVFTALPPADARGHRFA